MSHVIVAIDRDGTVHAIGNREGRPFSSPAAAHRIESRLASDPEREFDQISVQIIEVLE